MNVILLGVLLGTIFGGILAVAYFTKKIKNPFE